MRKVRYNDTDRAILAVLEANQHPMTASEIGMQVFSKHEGWDGDQAAYKRSMGKLTGSLKGLRNYHRVWMPLKGYWAFACPESSEHFFGWLSVLSDGLEDGTAENPDRAVSVLVRFCEWYGPREKPDAALDCTLLRPTMFQAFVVLMHYAERGAERSRTERLSMGHVIDVSLIDRAIVKGLKGNPWLDESQFAELLPLIMDYVNATGQLRGGGRRHKNHITMGFLTHLSLQADLELEVVFQRRREQ